MDEAIKSMTHHIARRHNLLFSQNEISTIIRARQIPLPNKLTDVTLAEYIVVLKQQSSYVDFLKKKR